MKSIWLQMRVNKGRRGNILTRVEDLEVKQRQKIFHNTSIVRVSDLTDDLGEIVAGRFTALGASATETEPTASGFVGSFMDGDGITFSDGTILNVGSSKNGNYAAGFNNDGDFVAAGGNIVINENGISAGGRVAIDENGVLLDGGENIFMDSDGFTGILSSGSGFSTFGTGANDIVYCVAKDGSGNYYFGGEFTFIGGISAKRFAKFDGTTWSTCGIGIGDGAVKAIAVVGSNIWIGGTFTKTENITSENDDQIGDYEVPVGGGRAYAQLNYIARFDGTKLNQVANGGNIGADGEIRALAVNGTTLYAGGLFTTVLGTSVSNVASIDTTGPTASALSTGLDGAVSGLVYSTDLYACGAFTGKVAKYSGGAWATHGTGGPNGNCFCIAKSGNDVYVGGSFTSPVGNFAKCTSGGAWASVGALGPQVGAVYSVAIDGTTIFVGGDENTVNSNVAYWNGSSWIEPDNGVDNAVYGILKDTSSWILVGEFSRANNRTAYFVVSYYLAAQPASMSLQTILDTLDAHNHFSLLGGHANGGVPLSTTEIATLFRSGVVSAANESQYYVPMPAGTMRNLRVYTDSTQSGTGSLVVTVRKNGADTALTTTVGPNAPSGVYSDTNTVSFSAGDKFTLELTNNATATSAGVRGFTVEFITRN